MNLLIVAAGLLANPFGVSNRQNPSRMVGRDSVEPAGGIISVAPGSTCLLPASARQAEFRPIDARVPVVGGSERIREQARPRRVFSPPHVRAFTLVELLAVIAIIAVLIGLVFPAYQGVQDQAKRMQARNDLVQIVNAVNAYYTEYGKYPLTPATPMDTTYGTTTTNEQLFNVLRAVALTENPRGIVFLSPPDAKDVNNPRAGISSAPATVGQYFDPWGKPYLIRLDTDYDNQVRNPYALNAGSAPLLRSGVIGWSIGKDALSQSTSTIPGDKNIGTNKDDVISWQ